MNVGHRVILPVTLTVGPCYMSEHQQDTMSYIRKYGHPDLLITTPRDYKDNSLPGQEPHDVAMLGIWFLETTCITV